jgi:hypothetical protein
MLRPCLLVDAVWEIDLEALARAGTRALILDLDNTIVDWQATWVRPQVRAWVEAARARGFGISILSNALRGGRVEQVARELGLVAVARAGKPLPLAFRRGMILLGSDPCSTCAVGDQVFTDILGANWLGMTTVLVRPLSSRESPHTRLIRLLERPLRRRWERQSAARASRPVAGGSGRR